MTVPNTLLFAFAFLIISVIGLRRSEEKVGDKDHNIELEKNDEILGILLNMHEDVPLEDPGPNNAIEDGGNWVAGETQ